MPTYDYQCTACSNAFEKFQQISAKPLRRCPMCGGALRRLIGPGAGVIFKGSGFYETDYKRKRPAAPAADSGKTDGAKADKPDAKPPKKPDE